jgi:hypothetical protein
MELLKENFYGFQNYFKHFLENQDRILKILMGLAALKQSLEPVEKYIAEPKHSS